MGRLQQFGRSPPRSAGAPQPAFAPTRRHLRPAWAAILSLFALASAPRAGRAATQIWTDVTANHFWNTPGNWSGGAVPGSGDMVKFDDRKTDLNIVDANFNVGDIIVSNTTGRIDTFIQPGLTLRPTSLSVSYNTTNANMLIHGGGTLRLGAGATDCRLRAGYRPSACPGAGGTLVVSNVTVNAENLYELSVGFNYGSGGVATGLLDLTHAVIHSSNAPNMLVINANNPTYGGLRVSSYIYSFGVLRLPPALTNLEVRGRMEVGSFGDDRPSYFSVIDFGRLPQIRQITATHLLHMRYADFIYDNGSSIVTGLPPNVRLTVGRPDSPASDLSIGHANAIDYVQRWRGFRCLETYVSNLYVGTPGGPNVRDIICELDLTSTSITELIGNITPTGIALNTWHVGYPRRAEGRIWLPTALKRISVGAFGFGSGSGNGVEYSFIHFGTNTGFQEFRVTNQFDMAKARFLYTDGSGEHEGVPGGLLRLGEPAGAAATLNLGVVGNYGTQSVTTLGGFSAFEGYLQNVTVAWGGYSNPARTTTAILDLRSCTSLYMEVAGDMVLGTNLGAFGYVYFPPGEAQVGRLLVGSSAPPFGESNVRGFVSLSNTVLTVREGVWVGDPLDPDSPSFISNCVAGLPSGISLETNLLSITNGGRMALNFAARPQAWGPYWGFRVRGDHRSWLQAFTNGPDPRIQVQLGGLSDADKARFGVHYHPVKNYTYIGVPPADGTLFVLH